METQNGLIFFAKRPEYLFIFKLRELVDLNFESVLSYNYDTIENKNLLKDVEALFCLACTYAGHDRVINLINDISDCSSIMQKMKSEELEKHNKILNAVTKYLEFNKGNYVPNYLKK